MMLKIDNLTVGYSNEVILRDVNLNIQKNESIAIIGGNGSGKSTFLKAIIGIADILQGQIILDDLKINCLEPWEKTRDGFSYITQIGGGLFSDLTVKDHFNLMPQDKLTERSILDKYDWIHHAWNTKVSFLSGGQQRFLSILLALFLKPRIMLLDEPSAELDPYLKSELHNLISSLRGNCALIIVEQNISFIAGLTDKIYCIDKGKMVVKS